MRTFGACGGGVRMHPLHPPWLRACLTEHARIVLFFSVKRLSHRSYGWLDVKLNRGGHLTLTQRLPPTRTIKRPWQTVWKTWRNNGRRGGGVGEWGSGGVGEWGFKRWTSIRSKGRRNTPSYYMASCVSGQDKSNPVLWLVTRAGKMEQSCPLGTTRRVPQEKFPQKSASKSFIGQACSVKMAGYWSRSFFASLWTSTPSRSVSVHKHAIKELGQYPAILTSYLVNNLYLFSPYGKRNKQTNKQTNKKYTIQKKYKNSHMFTKKVTNLHVILKEFLLPWRLTWPAVTPNFLSYYWRHCVPDAERKYPRIQCQLTT